MTTTFAFAGRTRSGESVSGERVVESVDSAVAALRREQILVTKIDAVQAKSGSRQKKGVTGKPVPPKSLAVFTRQFSVMIDAGLPLVECLEILGKQEDDANFRETILEVRGHVEGGSGLAEAMGQYPETFDALYSNMIAAGEAGGVLDTILNRLAIYVETNVKLRSQVKSALTYPVAVVVIAGLVVAAILWKVIPTFASLFEGLGAVLPLPTRVVSAVSESFVTVSPFLILGGGVGAVLLRRFYRTPRGRRVADGALLKAPVVGMVLRKVAVARFCRTLATLLSSGVPILEGLAITAKTSGNAVIEDAVMTARGSIEGGASVSAPLEHTGVFPLMVTQMINIGEATGALDTMLSKIADFYEEEVDAAVSSMLSLLEPIMIAFLGVVVGGIVMYMPIFALIGQMAA